MEDGDGLDICEGGDGARGMGVRGTEVVLAPRGEMGSFTQMPPTSLLCSHQPAISTLNNVPNPDPNFSDPSTSIFALSSLRKLLLPGTLRIGPISHVGTFFVDCGADDIFMDSKLAEELKDPGTWKTSSSRQNSASEPRSNGTLRSGRSDSGEDVLPG
ncbi:hypothetical protein BASA81_017833 [Batrachochytrium salamandrivorans]|nr:hypothetical protein BASA81_017833 [Batrachochytrium salamandrivorans]